MGGKKKIARNVEKKKGKWDWGSRNFVKEGRPKGSYTYRREIAKIGWCIRGDNWGRGGGIYWN